MGRIVGILFFVLAGVAVVSQIVVHVMALGSGDPAMALSGLTNGLSLGLGFLGFGLVYWLIEKAASNTVSIVFGWIHLALAVIHLMLNLWGLWMQGQLMNGMADYDYASLGIVFGAASLVFVIAMVCHIVAIIAAVGAARPFERQDVFR